MKSLADTIEGYWDNGRVCGLVCFVRIFGDLGDIGNDAVVPPAGGNVHLGFLICVQLEILMKIR